ncbi:MAG: hypothetical protein QM820_30035 [Minicystis sp.]
MGVWPRTQLCTSGWMVKLMNVGWLLNVFSTVGSKAPLKLCQVTVDSLQGARMLWTSMVPGPLGATLARARLTVAVTMLVLFPVGMALRSHWRRIWFSAPLMGPVFIVWEVP